MLQAIQVMTPILATIIGAVIWLVAREKARGVNNEGMRRIKELENNDKRQDREIEKLQDKNDNLTELIILKK